MTEFYSEKILWNLEEKYSVFFLFFSSLSPQVDCQVSDQNNKEVKIVTGRRAPHAEGDYVMPDGKFRFSIVSAKCKVCAISTNLWLTAVANRSQLEIIILTLLF